MKSYTKKDNREYYFAIIECGSDEISIKRILLLPWEYILKLFPTNEKSVFISIAGIDKFTPYGAKNEIRKAIGFEITEIEKKF